MAADPPVEMPFDVDRSGEYAQLISPPSAAVATAPAGARAPVKPNILFIMGDGIGWMQPSIHHRGLMVGETPNIDRIGNEGALFTDYYAEQSCTAGGPAGAGKVFADFA